MLDVQELRPTQVQADVWSKDRLEARDLRELVIAAVLPAATVGANRFPARVRRPARILVRTNRRGRRDLPRAHRFFRVALSRVIFSLFGPSARRNHQSMR
jgi:hypothetical protein